MEAGESLQKKHSQELLGVWPSTPTHQILNAKCNILSPRHCFDEAKCPSPPGSIGIIFVTQLYVYSEEIVCHQSVPNTHTYLLAYGTTYL